MTEIQRRIAIAVAAVVILAVVWNAQNQDVTNLNAHGSAIVAFGDSLTAGYGAGEGADYPSRLSALVSADIINAGVNGDTTGEALARLDSDVLAKAPRIVIVGLGGNDFLRSEPIAATESNLRTIVRNIQGRGAMVVLLGFNFPSLGMNYSAMYERIADEYGCVLVPDIIDGILGDPKLKSDDIHPNAAGYALMAQRISTPLSKLIRKADAAR